MELQQVIEQSTRDYKIFWGWLYGVIIRLVDENVPDDVAAVSQQDITYLAAFLNTFDQYAEVGQGTTFTCVHFVTESTTLNRFSFVSDKLVTKRKFNLERVGQYLKNENLQIPSQNNIVSEWSKLLDENDCLKKSSVIYPHHREMSLVQEHIQLKKSIIELFAKPEQIIGQQFKFKMSIDITDLSEQTELHLHHINVEAKNSSLFTITVANELLYFIEFTSQSDYIKMAKFQFLEKPFMDSNFQNYDDIQFRHSQFYNDSTMSVLLGYKVDSKSAKGFVQFPLQHFQSRLFGIKLSEYIDLTQCLLPINLYELLDPSLLRTLEMSDGHIISVSGSRKIATILSESQRRLHHYEMEVEDDDEEIDVSQLNSSLNASKASNQSN